MVKCKTWKTGTNTQVITIPREEILTRNIQPGDYLDITINQHIPKPTTKNHNPTQEDGGTETKWEHQKNTNTEQ